MMIVRSSTSSSRITRQSPTRSRDSGRPLSFRSSALRGSLTRRAIAVSTRWLTWGSSWAQAGEALPPCF
jgi:hypothetical protein